MVNPNLIAAAAFVCIVVVGLMAMLGANLYRQRASARIAQRMQSAFGKTVALTATETLTVDSSLFNTQPDSETKLGMWFAARLSRLDTVAGAGGKKFVITVTILATVVALVTCVIAPIPAWSLPFVMIGAPVGGAMWAYRFLVNRFKDRFLGGFSEALDMIVRAVRAGIPVTQVIINSANECPEPLGREFRLMGDSLQVGLDLEEVLVAAGRRIQISDFSFFCVCLLVQRETGGQLSETLENLSSIIRTRREIRQKARALTGEARITTKILTAIPFVIVGGLYAINRPYVEVLFETEAGHKLLTFAVVSITLGLLVVTKMSKLETSR
ncbi:type II secretion system F family protein [Burkholderia sp. Ac-20379]|uniref:type II secretion system F family protein n=1 Tax=Burkholderia sp. Ac-20379 TaxID=2703900 RepID=UPI00198209DB|nr:type II secretion system F family protein [Burkholderia sp. Ac-20379]MBN3726364.1 secretion system protein [Burkholderia sp. Ac-20379]